MAFTVKITVYGYVTPCVSVFRYRCYEQIDVILVSFNWRQVLLPRI